MALTLNPGQFGQLLTWIREGLSIAECAVRLDVDVTSLRDWIAVIDGPGPLDATVSAEDGVLQLDMGPIAVRLQDGDASLHVELPGPDLLLEHIDGELVGPRFVPERDTDTDTDTPGIPAPETVGELLELPRHKIANAVRRGRWDDRLPEVFGAEERKRGRRVVLNAVRRRARKLEAR